MLSIGTHGADQDMLQRVLATNSEQAAARALMLSGLGATVVILLYLTVGYLLAAAGLEGVGEKTPLVDYINVLNNPWLAGGFAVLLIAAAMSTLDSAMHSTGAIWKSVLWGSAQDSTDSAQAASAHRGTRIYSALSLLILTLVALGFAGVSGYRNFLDLAMSFMNYVNGGLIGVFTVFVIRSTPLSFPGVLVAILSGLLVTFCANFAPDLFGTEARLGWTYTTIASAAAATIAAWLVELRTAST